MATDRGRYTRDRALWLVEAADGRCIGFIEAEVALTDALYAEPPIHTGDGLIRYVHADLGFRGAGQALL